MKELGKVMILAAAAALIVWIHWDNKRKSGSGWLSYGLAVLGIRPAAAGRKRYLDELRLLATVLVILVHSMQSAASQLLVYTQAAGLGRPVLWYVLTGAAGLGLCCNLLFVMISGALLLPNREETAGAFYRKRVAKVAIPLIAYYLFYLRRSGMVSFSPTSIGAALRMVISGPMELTPHFWLIYVLIGLYIGVPFLRWMLRELPDSALRGMAAVILAGAAAKTGCYLLGTGFGLNAFLFSWEGIFLLGYSLTRDGIRKYDRAIWGGGAAAAALIVWFSCTREDAAVVAANDSVLMILYSMAIFLLFLRREERQMKRAMEMDLDSRRDAGETDEGRGGMRDEERRGRRNERGDRRDRSGNGRCREGRLNDRITRGAARLRQAALQMISRYSYSILLIHWFMLFVVVEKHLHIGPMMFGGKWILAGAAIQSAAALLFSLVFAVAFDQTVVLLGLRCWEGIVAIGKQLKW